VGTRVYDDQAVARLRFIGRAKQLGLPLEEIRDLAAVWDTGSCAPVQDRLAALLTDKIAEVRARVVELMSFAEQLTAVRDGLGRHTPDGCCDDACGCLGPVGGVSAMPPVVPLLRSRPEPPPSVSPAVPALVADSPLACGLTGPQQDARAAERARLLAEATGWQPTADGFRVTFPADAELAGRVASLAAREQQCCPLLAFTVAMFGAVLVLDVRAPGVARGHVREWFGSRP
jgi:DNA-binding transcriptional MerR regulator